MCVSVVVRVTYEFGGRIRWRNSKTRRTNRFCRGKSYNRVYFGMGTRDGSSRIRMPRMWISAVCITADARAAEQVDGR